MKRTTASLCALVVVSVLVSTAVVIAVDNNVGTWQLNLAKSNYSPGPAPKSQTLKIEAWGDDGVTYAADGVGADGKPTHTEFQAKYDGKDYPFKGNPDADKLSYKRIDANTLEVTTTLKGKNTTAVKVVVSADGKTRTVTQMGTNAQGQALNVSSVYERQ
ncbi:MAG: hypothetical protein ABW292_06215 [Vicinamibacterales bacterium]